MRKVLFKIACFASMLFLGLYYTTYQSIIDVLAAYFNTPAAALGFVISLHFIGGTLGTLFTGEIAERLGKKPVLLCALGLVVLGALLTTVSSSLFMACAGIFILGFGFIGLESMVTSGISDESGNKKELFLSFLHIFFSVGAVLAPMVVAYAFDYGSMWRQVFLCCALAPLLLAAAFGWSRFGGKPRRGVGRKSVTMEMLRIPAYCVTLLILFFYLGVETGLGFWAKAIILDAGGTPELAALGLSMFWFAIILGRFLSGLMYKLHERVLTAGLLMGIMGGAVALLAPGAYAKLAGFFIIGLGAAPVWPLVNAMALRVVPRYSAACMSTVLLVSSVGGVVLPPVLSVLAGTSVNVAIVAIGIYFVLMLALRIIYKRIMSRPNAKILAREQDTNLQSIS